VDSPTGVQKTGISAMADHDLQFISRTKYYYYSYWQANLRTEDIAVQNLLISPKSTREISYSILLLQKNGFEPEYLLESARNVGISKQVRGIISFMSGKEVTDPFLPSRTDIEDLYRQYGVQ
jgi:hypothetical protein